jgi:hypothetical protein
MKLPTLPATFTGASATVATATVGVTLVVAAAVAGAYLISGAGDGSSVASGQTGSSDRYVGAPGPIAGASLPGIIVVGCGAYWLVRRRRRKSDSGPRGDLKD